MSLTELIVIGVVALFVIVPLIVSNIPNLEDIEVGIIDEEEEETNV